MTKSYCFFLILFFPIIAIIEGCWVPIETGKRLIQQTDTLENEQRQIREKVETLSQNTQSIENSLGKIQQTVKDINQVSGRNIADIGAQLDRVMVEIQKLRGEFDSLQKNIEETKKNAAEKTSALTALPQQTQSAAEPSHSETIMVPAEKKSLYDMAVESLVTKKSPEKAQILFNEYLKKWPKDEEYGDNVHYWLGEIFYGEKKYQKAILEFQKIRTLFPKSDKVDDSILKIGYAFLELGLKEDAKLFFVDLINNYPKSELVIVAQKKMKELAPEKKKQ